MTFIDLFSLSIFVRNKYSIIKIQLISHKFYTYTYEKRDHLWPTKFWELFTHKISWKTIPYNYFFDSKQQVVECSIYIHEYVYDAECILYLSGLFINNFGICSASELFMQGAVTMCVTDQMFYCAKTLRKAHVFEFS